MSEAFDEATLDLLRLTIPTYGIIVPIILRSGTNEIIDGRHRMKIREELLSEGMKITLPVHHIDTDNPAEIDQIVNSVRRPWQDAAQRQELVKKLRERGHSHQRIADAVGTAKSTVQEDLKAQTPTGRFRPVGAPAPRPTKGKDGKVRKPPATPEEIARAWAMKDSGMSTPAIAKDLDRGEQTVRDWFKKGRPEAVQAAQPPAPAPAPQAQDAQPSAPTPEPKTASRDRSLPLPPLSVDLINREKKAAAKRAAGLASLSELNAEMERHWKAAQRSWEKDGRSVLRNHKGLADEVLIEKGTLAAQCEALGLPPNTSYQEMLRAIDGAAKKLSQSARHLLYFYGFTDTVEL